MTDFGTVFTTFEWALIAMAGATVIALAFFVKCTEKEKTYSVSDEGGLFAFFFSSGDGDGCGGDGGGD